MDFSAFDAKKIDDYAEQAKGLWGKTPEYREFEEKSKNRSPEEEQALGEEMMEMIAKFGSMMDLSPADEKVQEQVKKIQDYITEHCYTCTDKILKALGRMYAGGGSITENIDKAGGPGTAEFIKDAIDIYCEQ